MNICISKEALDSNKVTFGEMLLLLAYSFKVDLDEAQKSLIERGYITQAYTELFEPEGFRVTNEGSIVRDYVIAESEKTPDPIDKTIELALKLKEVFPKGKKDGTQYYWSDGASLIVKRLKLFYKKYGTDFDNDKIINAAQKYVQSFNGDYRFMQILKYFIFKEKRNALGEVESESQLLNYLENEGEEDVLGSNWMSTLN